MIACFRSGEDRGVSRNGIFRAAETVHQQESEFDLRRGVALLCGFLEPVKGIAVALGNTKPAQKQIGKVVLTKRVVLIGREAIKTRSGGIVLHDAETSIIEVTEVSLSTGITSVSSELEIMERFRIIAAHTPAIHIEDPEISVGASVTLLGRSVKPGERGTVALRRTPAIEISNREIDLSRRITSTRR